MKLNLPPQLVKKLVWIPVISFCKIFIPSYAFDALLCKTGCSCPIIECVSKQLYCLEKKLLGISTHTHTFIYIYTHTIFYSSKFEQSFFYYSYMTIAYWKMMF
jgi:hypothetical protein